MLLRPHYLFKYKTVDCKEDLERLKEILNENRLYLPDIFELNDPFEGISVNVQFGYAGSSINADLGNIDIFYESKLKEYKLISFSSIVNSPIMWAHYTNQYRGCCIIFSTKNTLKKVEPIIYTDTIFDVNDNKDAYENLSKIAHEALKIKKRDWSYENEWRYIKKTSDKFLKLRKKEIIGIIIGENMDRAYQEEIASICESKGIWCIKPKIMLSKSEMKFIPYDCKRNISFGKAVSEIKSYEFKELIYTLNGEKSSSSYYNLDEIRL